MIRVGITADTHADENSRLAEHDRIMAWIADDMAARGVDLALHAGDVYERVGTTHAERASVGTWVRRVTGPARGGWDGRPLVLVAGNHDPADGVAALSRSFTAEGSRHPVYAFDRPGVVEVAGCVVAALPWPRRAHLLAAIGRPVSHEESGVVAQDLLRNVLLGLGVEMDAHLGGWGSPPAWRAGPRILLTHVDLDGARTDHDQPVVNGDMKLSVADLALARADFVACGHIHSSLNSWNLDGCPVVYPGSPRHCNFGEPGEKSYVIADFESDLSRESGWRCAHWERIPTPSTPMRLLESTWDPVVGTLPCDGPPDVRGEEIRFRYEVDADQRDAARRCAEAERDMLLAGGAVSVRIEEVVRAKTLARAPKMASAKTTWEQLVAFWEAKGQTIEPSRVPDLKAKLLEIERRAATEKA